MGRWERGQIESKGVQKLQKQKQREEEKGFVFLDDCANRNENENDKEEEDPWESAPTLSLRKVLAGKLNENEVPKSWGSRQ